MNMKRRKIEMKKKLIWVMVSCLMVLSLVIASCGPKVEQEAEEGAAETVTVTLTKRDGSTMTRSVEKPIYGGTMITALAGDYMFWDPYHTQTINVQHLQLTSNELIGGNWVLGPQGTGDTDWAQGWLGDAKICAGELVESWELPDDTTIIYNLRHGIKFQNKAPAFGREMTADDVVWNFDYQFNNEGCWQAGEYPVGNPLRPTSWKALDRYTVEVKFPSKDAQSIMLFEIGDNIYISPPEVWTSGGDMNDWKKAIGSGPWLLTDYISGSSVTYSKNPDYFETDPLFTSTGEKYQLPYLDTFKFLIMTDTSSRIAALRTAKLDFLKDVDRENTALLKKDVPDIQWKQAFVGSPMIAAGRISQAPYNDIRVRRALNMAINKKEMVDTYYEGEAALIGYPFPPGKSWAKTYTPFEEQPKEVQEIFTYDPEKAKQLLEDAGYPNGFKATITCTAATADELSLIKEYWKAINVELELEVLEGGAWFGTWTTHGYKDMIYAPGLGCWAGVEQDMMTRKGFFPNISEIDDPHTAEFKAQLAKYILDDPDKMLAAKKDYAVWELQQAWGVFMPSPYLYYAWYPWVRNYYGINSTGGAGGWDWTKAIWIDQKMKTSMGY
jgi:peptide/nickel transport system substrate-binding protein